MSHYPFYNRYPYTNFEQLNLDALLSEVGSYSRRIEDLERTAVNHEARISKNAEDIAALAIRMTDAENDIEALGGRMDTAEGDIDALEGRMDTAENDIDALESRMDTAENDIDGCQGDISAITDDIIEIRSDISDLSRLASQVQRNTNDIQGIDSRVTTLEGHSVIANQGGTTSAVLSTLNVDGTNYEVPQGGGGGGSTVIPNASGTSQGDLNTIGIDGYIYDIPSGVDTSDLIAADYDPANSYNNGDVVIYDGGLYVCNADNVTGPWDSTKWNSTTCTDIANDAKDTAEDIEALYSALGTAYEDVNTGELDTSSSTKDYLPGTRRTLTPGSWLVTFNATFDTHTLGSKQRGLYTYLDVDGVTIAQGGKYMWGSEAINDINYANSVSISAVVDVAIGNTAQVTPYVRVPVNTGSGSYEVAVRVGYVCIKPRT